MVSPSTRFIDIHSHILPGIDDGAREFSDSIEIVKWLASQGVTDVVATPHYIDETEYISPSPENQKLLKKLKTMLSAEGIKINLYLGNEIYINDKIEELVKAKEITPLAGSEYLLIEMPLDEEFPNYEDHFLDLINNGYKVVLAHPERYAIIQKDYEIAERLHDAGVLFQCNLISIIGKYGNSAKKLIKKLAKDKMIFAFGSDVHHPGREDYLNLARKKFLKYYSEDELKKLLSTNPSKILKKVA